MEGAWCFSFLAEISWVQSANEMLLFLLAETSLGGHLTDVFGSTIANFS